MDKDRPKLKKLLKKSLKKGDFILTSGKKTKYYLNARNVTLTSEGAHLVANDVFEIVKKEKATAIGGPTIGADPIVGAVACLAYIKKYPLKTFIIRKSPKVHGDKKHIEGPSLNKKDRIILIDDTATTGKSLAESAQALRRMGLKINKAIVLVNREEGAKENLTKIDIDLTHLLKLKDLV